MAGKERAVVIFPGRGSYASAELGYLGRYHSRNSATRETVDQVVRSAGGTPPSELDALEKFSPARHLPGRNASNLIYACALSDFAAIDRDRFDIVAICGNSLGWYLSLAAAGALSLEAGAKLVDTMGNLMETEAPGGQLLYPVADSQWRIDPAKRAEVCALIEQTPDAFISIDLCGTLVLAGSDPAVAQLMEQLTPVDGRFPMKLPKHAAFHTPLLTEISAKARSILSQESFGRPDIPLIDGRGVIWSNAYGQSEELFDYTLRHQIEQTYDFRKSVEVALKEFAPDRLILAGPGSSLGPPVAQCLIDNRWLQVTERSDFDRIQGKDPFLLAMGREDQRAIAQG